MRVLILSDLWPPFPGGAERYVFNIGKALQERGAEVGVLTSYGRMLGFQGDEVRLLGGIPTHYRNIGCRGNGRHDEGWAVLWDFVKNNPPDIILTHQFFPDEFQAELSRCGIPIVQAVHATPRWPYVRFAIYNSEYTRRRNSSSGQRTDQDMVIHPPAFPDCVGGGTGTAIGFIKPVSHKGVDLVYRIAHSLPYRHFVVLRGEWWHFDKLTDLPNVEYIAPVDDMRDFYRRCRLMLVPSTVEDAGTVPQEAARNFIPCISTGAGGLQETNGGGIIIPEHDAEAWIFTIEHLLTDSHEYQAVRERQFAHLASFDWPHKFDELYRRMEALCK
jgi:glycosyltransferase involved in cell wall biosynthesis